MFELSRRAWEHWREGGGEREGVGRERRLGVLKEGSKRWGVLLCDGGHGHAPLDGGSVAPRPHVPLQDSGLQDPEPMTSSRWMGGMA